MNKERVSPRPWHVWDLLSGAARNGGTARRSHDGGVEAAKLETYRKLGGGMNPNQSEIRSKARSFRLGSESVANIEEGRREIVYICVCIVFAT